MRFILFGHYASKNGRNLRPCQAPPRGHFRGLRLTFAGFGSRTRLSHGMPLFVNRTFVWAPKRGCAADRGSASQEFYHGLSAGVDVQLLIDIGDVAAQRACADAEVVLNLFVKKPLGE